jgi:hypothetical protein
MTPLLPRACTSRSFRARVRQAWSAPAGSNPVLARTARMSWSVSADSPCPACTVTGRSPYPKQQHAVGSRLIEPPSVLCTFCCELASPPRHTACRATRSRRVVGNGSVTWNAVVDVARPPRAVFLRGNKSEVESNSGSGEAPTRFCAFMVATTWQPARGPDLVFFTLSCGAWYCSGTSAMGPA